MKSRFSYLTACLVSAELALAFFMAVAEGSAAGAAGWRGNRPARLHLKQNEPLSLETPLLQTGTISLYLPLIEYDEFAAERAALLALYTSTNGDEWYINTGWGTNTPLCSWYGVTCDSDGHVNELDLGGNGLQGILPRQIGDLEKMIILNLAGTYGVFGYYGITGPIPAEIGDLAHLEELNLRGNQITSLPSEIGDLTNLGMLDLSYNQLSSLPAGIGGLNNLQELYLLENHHLSSLPPEIGGLANLKILDLGSNQVYSLPPEIGDLANLQTLDLSDNHQLFLPPEIGNLINLQTLELGGNDFSYLPPEIGKLANLQTLDLSGNQLRSLPPEIGNLSNLQVLWLQGNLLSDPIPAFLSNLALLRQLYLNDNLYLTCWETQAALEWALSLPTYHGPTQVCGQAILSASRASAAPE